jgi:hypothetical protein
MWRKLKSWFKTLFRKVREVFLIIARDVGDDVLAILNDPDLQQSAINACRAAWQAGMSGGDAWTYALALFRNAAKKHGREVAMYLAETILQAAYAVWRAQGWPEGE